MNKSGVASRLLAVTVATLVAMVSSVLAPGSVSAQTRGVVNVTTTEGRVDVVGSRGADSIVVSQAAGILTIAGTAGSGTTVSINGASPTQSVSVPVASNLIIRTRRGADLVGLSQVSLDRLVIRTGPGDDRIILRDVGTRIARLGGGNGTDLLSKGLSRLGSVVSRNIEGPLPAPAASPPTPIGRQPLTVPISELG